MTALFQAKVVYHPISRHTKPLSKQVYIYPFPDFLLNTLPFQADWK